MIESIQWLLEGPAWVQYRVNLDLFGMSEEEESVRRAQLQMQQDSAIHGLIAGLSNWPGEALTSHKAAGHPLHRLVFLADLGLTLDDPGVPAIVEQVLAHVSSQGPFTILANVPRHFGGSGEDDLVWFLCDTPLVLYALARFGLGGQLSVQKAATCLAGLVRENGWPCAVSPEMGRFRGPGRKEDPCPYANLVMLQALAAFPEYCDSPAARIGVESALQLWAERRERHPYLFNMGTDFCKLKAPLVWYDLIHVLDVLTQFPWALGDPRLGEMLAVLQSKSSEGGRFTPESIWTAWKDWEFGQKKAPSRWLTFLALRILSRAGL